MTQPFYGQVATTAGSPSAIPTPTSSRQEQLKSLDEAAQYLKPGVAFGALDALALSASDLDTTVRIQPPFFLSVSVGGCGVKSRRSSRRCCRPDIQ